MQHRLLAKVFLACALCLAAVPALAASKDEVNGRLSSNWSGYTAARNKGDYTAVGASWTVTKLAATTTLMTDAAWVGIGGSKSKDLIQAGTHSAVQNGRTQYWAWYEMLPDYQVVIPLAVNGGDEVEVSLTEIADDVWFLLFINKTTGAQFGKALEYSSKRTTADWIQEMPVVYTRDGVQAYAPLSEFGAVTFTSAYAAIDGERKGISALRPSAVTMVSKLNRRVVLATPGEIGGEGFAVTRSSAVPSPSSGRRAHAEDIVWSK